MMNPSSMVPVMADGPESKPSAENRLEGKSLLGRLTDISNKTKEVVKACYATTKAQIQGGAELLRTDIKDGVERTVKSAEDKYLIANQAFQNVQIKTVDGIRAGAQGVTEQAKKLAGTSKEEGGDFISYTAEKFKDVAAKYKELPPKTKLAVGLTLTACGMWTGVLAGPAILSSSIAAIALAQRGLGAASTFMGLAEKLENIYAQEEAAGNKVSTGRKALGIGGSALIAAFIGSGEFAKVAGEGLKTAASFVGEKMEALGVNAAVMQSVSAIKEKVAMLKMPQKMPQFGVGEASAQTLPRAPFSENDVDGWGLSDTKRVDEVEMTGLTDTPPRVDTAERIGIVKVNPNGVAIPVVDVDKIPSEARTIRTEGYVPPEKIVPTVAIAGNENYAPGDRQTIHDDTIDPNVKQGEVSKPSASVAAAPIISDDVINDVVKKKEAEWDAAKAITLGQEEAVDVVKPPATQVIATPIVDIDRIPTEAGAIRPEGDVNVDKITTPVGGATSSTYNDLTEAKDRFSSTPQQVSIAPVIEPAVPTTNAPQVVPPSQLAPIPIDTDAAVRPGTTPLAPTIETTLPVPPITVPEITIAAAPAQVTTPSAVGSTVVDGTVGGTPVQAESGAGKVTLGQPSVTPAPITPPKIKVEDLTNFTKPQSGISETVASAVRPNAPAATNPFTAMAEAANLVQTGAVKNKIMDAVQSVLLNEGPASGLSGINGSQLIEDTAKATKFIQKYIGENPSTTVEALLSQKDGSAEFKTLQKAVTEIINKGNYGRDQLTTLKGKTLLDFFKLK